MHRVLPDPALNLAIRCRRDAAGRPVNPRLVVIGPATRPFVSAHARGRDCGREAEARMGATAPWPRPRRDLDRQADLADVSPRLARELTAALAGPLMGSRLADEAESGFSPATLLGRARHTERGPSGAAGYVLDVIRARRAAYGSRPSPGTPASRSAS